MTENKFRTMFKRRRQFAQPNGISVQRNKVKSSFGSWKTGQKRVLATLCILSIWIIALAPVVHKITSFFEPKMRSQNEMLLNKLNLSNITVLCPEGYTFSRGAQSCTTVCGYYDNYPLPLTICKRVLLSAIAVINTAVTILAIYRLIRYRRKYRFQHHPIFIGVFVNLILSIVIGVPDIIGAKSFFCNGEEVDYGTLNANPNIQVHIHGAVIQAISISNRVWFVMALLLIFLTKCTTNNICSFRRNRIIIILVEIVICLLFPVSCAVKSYQTGYVFAPSLMMPIVSDKLVGLIFGMIPHLSITGMTLTLIVLILYNNNNNNNNCRNEKQKVLIPIEKRIMFFSVLYFLLNILIVMTLISTSTPQDNSSTGSEEIEALITLESYYTSDSMRFIAAGTQNRTLSLLSTPDQELIQYSTAQWNIPVQALSIRLLFIVVLSALNCCIKDSMEQKIH